MAIAYATAGKFNQAAQSEKKAIELASQAGEYEQMEKYKKYLSAYLEGKTY